MSKKTINKEKTIQNIIKWKEKSFGHVINLKTFKQKMAQPNWENQLKEVTKFCGIPIIYDKK